MCEPGTALGWCVPPGDGNSIAWDDLVDGLPDEDRHISDALDGQNRMVGSARQFESFARAKGEGLVIP